MPVDALESSMEPKIISDVGYFSVHPGLASNAELTRGLWDTYTNFSKAIVIEAYGSGTTPEVLNPLIKDYVDKGGCVFLLSNNPGENRGILQLKYEPQVLAVEAGAVPLRDVNVNNRQAVSESIQDAINQGKTGEDLKRVIIEKYGTPLPPKTA